MLAGWLFSSRCPDRPGRRYHVAGKDEILGIVDLVFGEMEVPSPAGDWGWELHRRNISAINILRAVSRFARVHL